ncbi:FAD/NAD-P-binding domain-containing protein [Epithele typhae]|uniref:FAD/NAD-P-binding domain-containing protein n=1 Tax=Epithele typhae TaxID=378194 RepID=UPI002007D386|nr:FAD/NAD-P-binding domain-containing protein [Epithele typhae]KAH9921562.1 FAD/NAD-P-binding domain-containing protein [Epithele typhae]
MEFDAIVLGTGLSESIAAAALSKVGYRVAHIDTNAYYGGDQASLTLDELVEWATLRSREHDASADPSFSYFARQRARYSSIAHSPSIPPQSRQYSISLAPSIVPSVGPHIDSLIASGVSRYGSFKLLEKVAVYDRPGYVQSVPGSKEDVFKSKVLSLVDKRRLMRFLMFAAGEFEGNKELEGKEQTPFTDFLREAFSLNDKAATAIVYALAFCMSCQDPTLPALLRIRQYLRSAGRYGASPFLVGHYGGLGETAQGFCRTAAVKGGTYILGRRIVSISQLPPSDNADPNETAYPGYSVRLEDLDELVISKVLVSSPDYLPESLHSSAGSSPSSESVIARCIAVVDKPLIFTPMDASEEPSAPDAGDDAEEGEESPARAPPDYEVDTALLVFPPGSLDGGSSTSAAHAIVTGEGSMSAPRGKWIVNISLPLSSSSAFTSSAEELIKPYLDATLSLTAPPSADGSAAVPLFTVFYYQHAVNDTPSSSTELTGVVLTPPCTQDLASIADSATQHAEGMFWTAVGQLKAAGVKRGKVPTGRMATEEVEEEGQPEEIDALWPPLDAADEEAMDEF